MVTTVYIISFLYKNTLLTVVTADFREINNYKLITAETATDAEKTGRERHSINVLTFATHLVLRNNIL